MGDCFNKMEQSPTAPFTMIEMIRFAKMCSANQTGLFSNPMIGHPGFSGQHIQVFTDEFLDYLGANSAAASVGVTKNIETLKNLLMQTKESLTNRIEENRRMDRGTTK